ncbi:beta family protein [Edaphobacter modestus]|uniref:T4 beta protein n=1 Tax=Edaphobacter modestus TaxID=388466 RepID=A0A4Q7YXE8_9BACT|nr:beta family protein [Edaphobacter modestus]RZU42420.1 T4 beta protein [Edaphobacter modestus]
MPEPIYVPILKGKEGEYAALEALATEIKDQILPLIEIPSIPWDFASECPAKSLDDHISGIPDKLKRACGTTPFYLDLPWFDGDETLANGMTALEAILTKGRELGLEAIPVIYRASSEAYLSAAKAHSSETGSGICVRLLVEDFDEDVPIEKEVDRLLTAASPEGDDVDLIVDLEDLGVNTGTKALVARSIFTMIPREVSWRRMTLAAASFPEDLSDVSAATIVKLPRHEWDLWKTLQKRPGALPRPDLIFGDYAMAHPVAKTNIDPRTMRMSANIRYTAVDDWLVIKGRNVRKYGFDQYFELCRLLVSRPEYSGRNFSWGDSYIAACAEATLGPGNATTWRKVGVNHHITLVTTGLASLRASV